MERKKQIAEDLALMRMAVGAIGEDKILLWWRSAFCGNMAGAYLSPMFPKTVFKSALAGVTAAACRVHDEHIGVGRVFHLFRLPEEYERVIADAISAIPASRVNAVKESVAAAKEWLKIYSEGVKQHAEGPVSVGKSDELSHPSVWRKVAAIYLDAANTGVQALPYFGEK